MHYPLYTCPPLYSLPNFTQHSQTQIQAEEHSTVFFRFDKSDPICIITRPSSVRFSAICCTQRHFAMLSSSFFQITTCCYTFYIMLYVLRYAIRYALGPNLGRDQTVMLDWRDDEKMTLEKLLRPSWSYQRVFISRWFYKFLDSHWTASQKSQNPNPAEEFGQKLEIRIIVSDSGRWICEFVNCLGRCCEFFHTPNTSRWTRWQVWHVWNTYSP